MTDLPAATDTERQAWVLRDSVSGVYFVRMTGIGPMGGSLDEAARFSTEQAAMQSPAFSFSLTFFRPVEIRDA